MYIQLNSTQRKFAGPQTLKNKFSKNNICVCFEVMKKLNYKDIKSRLNKVLIMNPILKSKYSVNKKCFQYSSKNKLHNLSYLENVEISLLLKKINEISFKIDKHYHFKIFFINNKNNAKNYIIICINHNICDGLSLNYFFKALLGDGNNIKIIKKSKIIDSLEKNGINLKNLSYDEDGIVDKHEVVTKNIFHNPDINYNISKFLDTTILALFNSSRKHLNNFIVKELFKFQGDHGINNELDFYLYSLEEESLNEKSISEKRQYAKKNHTPFWDLVKTINPLAYNGYYGIANIEINYRARAKGFNIFQKIPYIIHFNEETLNFAEADISLIIDQMSEEELYYKFLFNRKIIPQKTQTLILENFSNYISKIKIEETKFRKEVNTCCVI